MPALHRLAGTAPRPSLLATPVIPHRTAHSHVTPQFSPSWLFSSCLLSPARYRAWRGGRVRSPKFGCCQLGDCRAAAARPSQQARQSHPSSAPPRSGSRRERRSLPTACRSDPCSGGSEHVEVDCAVRTPCWSTELLPSYLAMQPPRSVGSPAITKQFTDNGTNK